MDAEDYYFYEKLQLGACKFVEYDGLLTPAAVADYLIRYIQTFDAVGVLGGNEHADVRRTLDDHFDGLKFLFDWGGTSAANPDYIRVVGPVFDRTVREAFADIKISVE